MNVLPSKHHTAFQIIGDSGAAQHCRGLDDIPINERCKIRKADVPLIFVTANGEVPCDEVIATDIPQLGITRDMYVMKDSPSVISIGRLVIDDGYDFVWKHRDRRAVLISPQGKRHNLWTDNFTPMLAAQTSQKLIGSDNGLPSPAPVDTPSSASAELSSPGTVERQSRSVVTDALPDPASDKSRPSWYRGPKRYVDKLEKVLATSNTTQFIEMFSGQCGLSKALQSLGHVVHSYDKKNDPNQDALDKKYAQ